MALGRPCEESVEVLCIIETLMDTTARIQRVRVSASAFVEPEGAPSKPETPVVGLLDALLTAGTAAYRDSIDSIHRGNCGLGYVSLGGRGERPRSGTKGILCTLRDGTL